MRGIRYRLCKPTVAVHGEHRRCFVLPSNAAIELTNPIFDENRTTFVICEGQEVVMFTQDIRERGSRLVSGELNAIPENTTGSDVRTLNYEGERET